MRDGCDGVESKQERLFDEAPAVEFWPLGEGKPVVRDGRDGVESKQERLFDEALAVESHGCCVPTVVADGSGPPNVACCCAAVCIATGSLTG